MEDSAKIRGGISGLGDKYPSINMYNKNMNLAVKNNKNYKRGEILKGKINKIVFLGLGEIIIPSGSIVAEIPDKLRAGDELYFIVEKSSPNLILNIYSVFYNQPDSINDIIRKLNLPDIQEYENIIEIIRENSNIIIRNEVLLLKNNFIKLIDKKKDKTKQIDNYRALYKLNLLGMHSNNIEIESMVFSGINYIEEIMISIINDLNNRELREFKQKYSIINGSYAAIILAITEQNSESNILQSLQISKKELKTRVTKFIQLINHWNSQVYSSTGVVILYIPILSESDFKIAQCIVEISKDILNQINSFSSFLTKLNKLKNSFFIGTNDENHEVEFVKQLKDELLKEKIMLRNVFVSESNQYYREILEREKFTEKKSLSVVV